ncbi:hypothetical protein [Ornithinibacillus scapharcae]|uniref:hypothetical protein n=1 Tax=Ornithinibacillus scapharcae TaxID=1147159 RepID=UPI000225B5AE|nr:hypothetical protein [Ornithinibacillus scapharcae]
MLSLEQKILKRLQQSPPEDCSVVPRSTPVIAFGKFKTAEVATISLNPSYKEFEFFNGKNRFHTLDSLGLENYSEIDIEHQKQIIEYCETYFERDVVYKEWFDRMSKFLRDTLGFDYYTGTACHLDLSQWATNDIWGKLETSQKKALLSTGDLELVTEIIKIGNFHTVFLNGRTTSKEIYRYFGVKPTKEVLRKSIRKKTKKKI